MKKPRVLVITGPTATGKTALGVLLAKALNGEIVSADSMQIYRYMDIGTAKPTISERSGIPHHMLDILYPWERYSAARYVEDATICIEGILSRDKLPIIVGGTGLYIDSLLLGRTFSPNADSALRAAIEHEYDSLGGEAMLRKLSEFDLTSAAILHKNDKKRIVRAIEVYRTSGKTISMHDIDSKSVAPPFDAIKYVLAFSDRAELYSRIDKRVDSMLASGLIEEVRKLVDMGIALNCTGMQAIGYKEIVDVVLGKCDIHTASNKVKIESRRYAKRQLTWLRRDKSAKWILRDEQEQNNEQLSITIDAANSADKQLANAAAQILHQLC